MIFLEKYWRFDNILKSRFFPILSNYKIKRAFNAFGKGKDMRWVMAYGGINLC